MKYAMDSNPKNSVKVYGRNLRVSRKSSVTVCKVITGKQLNKGLVLLERVQNRKQSFKGKYYDNVVKELIDLLKSAGSNAEFKGLDTTRMIIHASAHKGYGFYRPRRFKIRRTQRKMTNIQIVLMEK